MAGLAVDCTGGLPSCSPGMEDMASAYNPISIPHYAHGSDGVKGSTTGTLLTTAVRMGTPHPVFLTYRQPDGVRVRVIQESFSCEMDRTTSSACTAVWVSTFSEFMGRFAG